MHPSTRILFVTLGALVATGCAHTSGPGVDPAVDASGVDPAVDEPRGDAAPATLDVDANLARLSSLDVFEVGDLIVQLPDGAFNCYGPCPGFEDAIAEAEAHAAQRLSDLVGVAEQAAAQPIADSCDPAVVDANLAALRALDVVHVGALLVEEPQNNPMCYNLPCSEDIEAAEAVTCARAGELAAIAAAAKGL